MEHTKLHLLLADDDLDDCDFFQEAMDELPYECNLSIVHNGVELMNLLTSENSELPNLIFLDLNMPRKSGMECIREIKASDKLSHIPIIIYSTSLDPSVVNELYEIGALHYIQKPAEFACIKKVIEKVLKIFKTDLSPTSSREHFIIQP